MEQYVSLIVAALISSVIGGLVARANDILARFSKQRKDEIEKEKKLDELRDAALRELMGTELRRLHEKFVVNKEPMTVNDLEHAGKVYNIYHGLGGNGTGTVMYKEICEQHHAGI